MEKIKKIIITVFVIAFGFCGMVYCLDEKEEMKQYVSKINPILINVQTTSRNISQKLVTLELAIKQMREYLGQLTAIKPPVFMAKQHKMISLSFKKMTTGFYLLSKGDRSASIPLVKGGAGLLRIAARNIVNFAKEKGLIKEKDSSTKSPAPIENNTQPQKQ